MRIERARGVEPLQEGESRFISGLTEPNRLVPSDPTYTGVYITPDKTTSSLWRGGREIFSVALGGIAYDAERKEYWVATTEGFFVTHSAAEARRIAAEQPRSPFEEKPRVIPSTLPSEKEKEEEKKQLKITVTEAKTPKTKTQKISEISAKTFGEQEEKNELRKNLYQLAIASELARRGEVSLTPEQRQQLEESERIARSHYFIDWLKEKARAKRDIKEHWVPELGVFWWGKKEELEKAIAEKREFEKHFAEEEAKPDFMKAVEKQLSTLEKRIYHAQGAEKAVAVAFTPVIGFGLGVASGFYGLARFGKSLVTRPVETVASLPSGFAAAVSEAKTSALRSPARLGFTAGEWLTFGKGLSAGAKLAGKAAVGTAKAVAPSAFSAVARGVRKISAPIAEGAEKFKEATGARLITVGEKVLRRPPRAAVASASASIFETTRTEVGKKFGTEKVFGAQRVIYRSVAGEKRAVVTFQAEKITPEKPFVGATGKITDAVGKIEASLIDYAPKYAPVYKARFKPSGEAVFRRAKEKIWAPAQPYVSTTTKQYVSFSPLLHAEKPARLKFLEKPPTKTKPIKPQLLLKKGFYSLERGASLDILRRPVSTFDALTRHKKPIVLERAVFYPSSSFFRVRTLKTPTRPILGILRSIHAGFRDSVARPPTILRLPSTLEKIQVLKPSPKLSVSFAPRSVPQKTIQKTIQKTKPSVKSQLAASAETAAASFAVSELRRAQARELGTKIFAPLDQARPSLQLTPPAKPPAHVHVQLPATAAAAAVSKLPTPAPKKEAHALEESLKELEETSSEIASRLKHAAVSVSLPFPPTFQPQEKEKLAPAQALAPAPALAQKTQLSTLQKTIEKTATLTRQLPQITQTPKLKPRFKTTQKTLPKTLPKLFPPAVPPTFTPKFPPFAPPTLTPPLRPPATAESLPTRARVERAFSSSIKPKMLLVPRADLFSQLVSEVQTGKATHPPATKEWRKKYARALRTASPTFPTLEIKRGEASYPRLKIFGGGEKIVARKKKKKK